MTPVELLVLRSTISTLRIARRHLNHGDLGHGFLMFSQARAELALGRGVMLLEKHRGASWERVQAAADRVERELFRAIKRASIEPQLADPAEIADAITQGILVLRTRDGVDISDEQAIERGRNLACGLTGAYRVLEPASEWALPVERSNNRAIPEGNGGSNFRRDRRA